MTDSGRKLVYEACQGLAAQDLGPGIGGHVSVRVPGEDCYWMNALDRTFGEVTMDDVLLVGFDGTLREGNRPVSPGIGFHPGIYNLRPDVGAIVHTHGFWVTAQSAFARPPRMYHNLATYFFNRTSMAPDDDIEAIAPTLKEDDIAIVIPWHGAITLGKDIQDAAALHATFSEVCRLDVTLDSGEAKEMPDEACAHIQGLLRKADYLTLTWQMMLRRAGVAEASN